MFGYVKPVKGELLVKDYEFYRATYCGICRAMKKHTGVLSNVTLSYDSVFLALIRMLYVPDEQISARKRRCIAHPLTRRSMLDCNPAIEYTARAFAMLAYYKLDDDAFDERFLRKLAARMMKPFVASARRYGKTRRVAEVISDKLAAIRELELARTPSVDEPAELFGELLGEVFSFGLEGEAATVTRACGYHLGKFIYSADAIDDYGRDAESGAYNPYVILYGGAPLTEENRKSVHTALLLECRRLEGAINLLPFGSKRTVGRIINNIVYEGLVDRISFLVKEADETHKKENDR